MVSGVAGNKLLIAGVLVAIHYLMLIHGGDSQEIQGESDGPSLSRVENDKDSLILRSTTDVLRNLQDTSLTEATKLLSSADGETSAVPEPTPSDAGSESERESERDRDRTTTSSTEEVMASPEKGIHVSIQFLEDRETSSKPEEPASSSSEPEVDFTMDDSDWFLLGQWSDAGSQSFQIPSPSWDFLPGSDTPGDMWMKVDLNEEDDEHDEDDEDKNQSKDACEAWLKCDAERKLKDLTLERQQPDCPCREPFGGWSRESEITWSRMLTDHLPGLHLSASTCYRSLSSQGGTGPSSQLCCFDRFGRLLTRGARAGSALFVSPDVSESLHQILDVLPRLACKGDFTRIHLRRPPNNGLNCSPNPGDEEFLDEINQASYY
ncbi:unnamed protein product [Darwinula stevensoni]|uniref:AMOP domain-containing protein n=1 Tax=Darwinula stevensoni TaxID=69355 RepID=A0A7R8X459_9CRUS|nr:unnamed protein product [Darwinula stevensoni]CAG0878690.1 unnamed protein product [Darwinula stevensoni]